MDVSDLSGPRPNPLGRRVQTFEKVYEVLYKLCRAEFLFFEDRDSLNMLHERVLRLLDHVPDCLAAKSPHDTSNMNVEERSKARSTLYDAGMVNRRQVMGDEYVDRALEAGKSSSFLTVAQEYVTQNAWEGIWGRAGLSFRERSLVVISIAAACGHNAELAGHVRGALNNGLKESEIQEAMLHVMGYCGFPTGLQAFRTAAPVIESWTAEQKDKSF